MKCRKKKFFRLPEFIENICGVEIDSTVAKSIICARFLQSTLQICPNFKKCCSFNDPTEDWTQICDSFNRSTNNLWKNWLEDIKKETEKRCTDFSNLSPKRSVEIMIVSVLSTDSIETLIKKKTRNK